MSDNFYIKSSPVEGSGLFAKRNIKKGEVILKYNILKSCKRIVDKSEIDNLGRDGDHLDYLGNGKYAIDYSPMSLVNHLCNPNSYTKFTILGKGKLIAKRDIQKNEEITKDYTLGAIDQIDNKKPWKLKCLCGSNNCRKIVIGDYFKMPKLYQKRNLKYLPEYFKQHYPERLKSLQ